MFNFLKDHPFAVEAWFENSLVLTFAVPERDAAQLIPPCLTPDTLNGTQAFVALALVQTKHLRPKGFPAFAGNDFILTGYRVFVRYTNRAGKKLRGLYILKSETNKKKMEILGNIFTHYNYATTDIRMQQNGDQLQVTSEKSGLDILVNTNASQAALPAGSPFESWKEARRFAGPLPFTFSYDDKTRKVLIIEGVRENWTPQPVTVIRHEIAYLKSLPVQNVVLANAFIIKNIPYYWKKGKTEIWNP